MDEIAEDVQTPASMKTELLNVYRTGALTKLGLKFTETTIKKASDKNIEKMYNEYQVMYNTQIADDVVKNLLFGYTQGVKFLFPNIEDQKLHEKLTDNFIINSEIKKQLGALMNPSLLAVMNVAANTSESVLKSNLTENSMGINEHV